MADPKPHTPDEIRTQGNQLKHEPSAYLRQHAHNPVDWPPWGSQALARARREHRLIFLPRGVSETVLLAFRSLGDGDYPSTGCNRDSQIKSLPR